MKTFSQTTARRRAALKASHSKDARAHSMFDANCSPGALIGTDFNQAAGARCRR